MVQRVQPLMAQVKSKCLRRVLSVGACERSVLRSMPAGYMLPLFLNLMQVMGGCFLI